MLYHISGIGWHSHARSCIILCTLPQGRPSCQHVKYKVSPTHVPFPDIAIVVSHSSIPFLHNRIRISVYLHVTTAAWTYRTSRARTWSSGRRLAPPSPGAACCRSSWRPGWWVARRVARAAPPATRSVRYSVPTAGPRPPSGVLDAPRHPAAWSRTVRSPRRPLRRTWRSPWVWPWGCGRAFWIVLCVLMGWWCWCWCWDWE